MMIRFPFEISLACLRHLELELRLRSLNQFDMIRNILAPDENI